MIRFDGTVIPLFTVDNRSASNWIASISFDDWPRQTPLDDGLVRPAMVTDRNWHNFHEETEPIIIQICLGLRAWGDAVVTNRMLSVVMPGARIEPHYDRRGDDLLGRVHIPLITSPYAFFIVGSTPFHMQSGWAYMVNTEILHSVLNEGIVPRIHLMFDIKRSE